MNVLLKCGNNSFFVCLNAYDLDTRSLVTVAASNPNNLSPILWSTATVLYSTETEFLFRMHSSFMNIELHMNHL